jgi:hypothetical protein
VCAVGAAGNEGGGVSEGPTTSELRARVEETLLSERAESPLGEGVTRRLVDACEVASTPSGPRSESDVWRGVYPGMCVDPEVCRGKTSCPRNYSCSE